MENLSLEYFRGKKFKFHINRGIAVFQIKNVIGDNPYYGLDFDVALPSKGMNLQRPLVWTLLQKQQLIISILKDIKLPPLTLILVKEKKERGDLGIYEVIDGKQRLTTLIDFVENKFPILVNDVEYYFKDLPDNIQHEIDWFWVVADVGYHYESSPITDDEKIRWFELINFSGTPQDEQHLKNLKAA